MIFWLVRFLSGEESEWQNVTKKAFSLQWFSVFVIFLTGDANHTRVRKSPVRKSPVTKWRLRKLLVRKSSHRKLTSPKSNPAQIRSQKTHESETSRVRKSFWVAMFLTRDFSERWIHLVYLKYQTAGCSRLKWGWPELAWRVSSSLIVIVPLRMNRLQVLGMDPVLQTSARQVDACL